MKVRTGNGTETATNLHQGRSWYVWNNDKDTAYLRNAEGTLIDTCSYNNRSASRCTAKERLCRARRGSGIEMAIACAGPPGRAITSLDRRWGAGRCPTV